MFHLALKRVLILIGIGALAAAWIGTPSSAPPVPPDPCLVEAGPAARDQAECHTRHDITRAFQAFDAKYRASGGR